MNILFITNYVPFPSYFNGNTLRVYHFSKCLSENNNCFLYSEEHAKERSRELSDESIFKAVFFGRARNRKHIVNKVISRFFKDLPYRLKRMHRINDIIRMHQIDIVIKYIPDPFLNLKNVMNIYDITDCQVLTSERLIEWGKRGIELEKIIKKQNEIISNNYRSVVISEVDKNSVFRFLDKESYPKLLIVPNGIDIDKFKPGAESNPITHKKAFAFWGNLSYRPNTEAIKWFYENVFLQFFLNSDYQWHIIGQKQDPFCFKIAGLHSNIILAGFVEDLQGYLGEIPVFINPVRLGAGLKNKVLEAMAMKKIIISTSRGAEGIPELVGGINYLEAETPNEWYTFIKNAISNRNEYLNMIQKNSEIINFNYSWGSVAGRFESHLKTIHQECNKY